MKRTPPHLTRIALAASPAQLLAAMPQDVPIATLVSCPEPDLVAGQTATAPHTSSARWSLVTCPTRFATDLAALDDAPGDSSSTPARSTNSSENHQPPFTTGWLALLSYGLGRCFEPAAMWEPSAARPPASLPPEVWLARVDHALIFDHARGAWWGLSEAGNPEGYRQLIPPALRGVASVAMAPGALGSIPPAPGRGFALSPLVPEVPRAAFEAMVARVLSYIHAGDCYQVNLAHRLAATFEGDARRLFLAMLGAASPWYASYFELCEPGVDVVAAPPRFAHCGGSPEGFLEVSAPASDGTRTIVTRPMKGTRRASDATSADLESASKDRAELAMIVDLMRNDLGRVSTLGSVRVTRPHTIERHGVGSSTLLQATATITATLAPATSLVDVLRATFPPGSVTGAPKIRAMQIIDELEQARRGPYCGCAGFLGDDGSARLSVSIRSALVERASSAEARPAAASLASFPAGSRLTYWVGAGIVADSDPASEWDETLAKAGAISEIARM